MQGEARLFITWTVREYADTHAHAYRWQVFRGHRLAAQDLSEREAERYVHRRFRPGDKVRKQRALGRS